jgi:hypothetical protein
MPLISFEGFSKNRQKARETEKLTLILGIKTPVLFIYTFRFVFSFHPLVHGVYSSLSAARD